MSLDERVQELGLELPPAPKPLGVYRPLVVVGNLIYVSGHAPLLADGSMLKGRVGQDLDLPAGARAARQCGLAILSTLRAGLGSLGRVQRLVRTLGLVNCSPDFHHLPAVVNGFSELMVEVFGPDRGVGVRSVVGAASLPGNIPVEVEAIFEMGPGS